MYRQRRGNLFDGVSRDGDRFIPPEGVVYCQCISADAAMGAGIATTFNGFFDTRRKIQEINKDLVDNGFDPATVVGACVYQEPVLCLVTKKVYWHKPTISTLAKALESAVDEVENLKLNTNIKEIRMPMIGCGLDKLQWERVLPELLKFAAALELLNVDVTVIDFKLPSNM